MSVRSLPLTMLTWICLGVNVCLSICLPRAYLCLFVLFQVLLGEVNAGLNTTQVVVKELKASASVQDQMHFLEEAQPYRYTFSP